jgi:hypothetical protein
LPYGVMVAGLALALAGCAVSPEATRQAGERGADIGNRREIVDMHGRTNPGHDVPVVGQGVRIETRATGGAAATGTAATAGTGRATPGGQR